MKFVVEITSLPVFVSNVPTVHKLKAAVVVILQE